MTPLVIFYFKQMRQSPWRERLLSSEAADYKGGKYSSQERHPQSWGQACLGPGTKVGGREIGRNAEKSRDCLSKKSPAFNLKRDSEPWNGCVCFILCHTCKEASTKTKKDKESPWVWWWLKLVSYKHLGFSMNIPKAIKYCQIWFSKRCFQKFTNFILTGATHTKNLVFLN